jgi:subtilisin-like proprotein convertase family protein
VGAALVGKAVQGKVTSPGSGSANRLLQTGFLNAETVVQPAPASACGPFVAGTDVTINRLGTATSVTTVTGCSGTASAASSVGVTVKHAYRGSLVVTLTSPAGVTYTLKAANRADKAADIVHTYPIDLSGTRRNGKWSLRVKDTYGTTVGVLDRWRLSL